MNKAELEVARNLVQQQFNNLTDHQWLAAEVNKLKGRYELLTELINKEPQEDAATNAKTTGSGPDSHNDQREQSLSGPAKGQVPAKPVG